jgi:hypothetical protein
VLLLAVAVVMIARDGRRSRRRRGDVLHYHHFSGRDARWGWRR